MSDWFVIRENRAGTRYYTPGDTWGWTFQDEIPPDGFGWSARLDAEDAAHGLGGRVVHRDELAAMYDMWKARMAVEPPDLSKYAIQVHIYTAGWFDGDAVTIPTESIRHGGGT